MFLLEMLSYCLSTVNAFYRGFKPVLSFSKPHTISTLFGEEKEINVHLLYPTLKSDVRCHK